MRRRLALLLLGPPCRFGCGEHVRLSRRLRHEYVEHADEVAA